MNRCGTLSLVVGLVLGAAGAIGAVHVFRWYPADRGAAEARSGADTPIKAIQLDDEVNEALQVLARSTGDWKSELHVKPAKWSEKERRISGTFSNKFALDHRFLHSTGVNDDGVENIGLATYDKDTKTYRTWYFDSRGIIVAGRGRWNPDSNTMTWESKTPQGYSSVFTVRYVDRDNTEMTHVIKDDDGTIYLDNEGKSTRHTPK